MKSDKVSPKYLHDNGEILDAKQIQNSEIALLCWPHCRRKVRKCRIKLDGFEFSIENNENRTKWNLETVDVYFHPKITKYVYLFCKDQFIEKSFRKKKYNEDSGSKFKQIAHNKSYREHLKRRNNKNFRKLNDMERDDPMLNMYYETSKSHSNADTEEFIQNYILPETQNSPAEFELHDSIKSNIRNYKKRKDNEKR